MKCPKFCIVFSKIGEEWIEPKDITDIWRNLPV